MRSVMSLFGVDDNVRNAALERARRNAAAQGTHALREYNRNERQLPPRVDPPSMRRTAPDERVRRAWLNRAYDEASRRGEEDLRMHRYNEKAQERRERAMRDTGGPSSESYSSRLWNWVAGRDATLTDDQRLAQLRRDEEVARAIQEEERLKDEQFFTDEELARKIARMGGRR